MAVGEIVGSLATQLSTGKLESIQIDYYGEIAEHDVTPLRASVIRGLLKPISVENVNIVKVQAKPKRRGLSKGTRPGWKKAIVQVREGDEIEIFEGAQV